MGHHHAFDVLDDVAADLHQQPFRHGAQHGTGLGGGIGDGNGFGTAHGGLQFFFQNLYVLLIADVLLIHKAPPVKYFKRRGS